jgi:hypothetical protein
MSVTVNWDTLGFGLVLLCIVVIIAVAWCFVDSRRIASAEAHNRRAFEAAMKSAGLPEWNGDTYDWTPESLAYLSETHLYAGPGVADTAAFAALPDGPVPPSEISGPLPVIDDTAFIERLRADNAAFLANLDVQ